MKFSLITFGCKVNQYESEFMSELMQKNGYIRENSPDDSDIVIINSCTVTSTGDNKVLKAIRRLRRENPSCIIVVTGCMTQTLAEIHGDIEKADIILGNSDRERIIPAIKEYLLKGKKIIEILPHEKSEKFEKMSVTSFEDRTRAFIKIEDGCNRFCSYCIIPYARGRVRSKPLDELRSELIGLSLKGYKEIVMTGINLSAYGTDTGASLCKAIELACNIPGIERVRLGSLEPDGLTPEVIHNLGAYKKLCPQFHMSLQSGSTSVLKRMNRHYTADEYFSIAEMLKSEFDNTSITTDIMVGFPGESEKEFQETVEFAKRVGFSKVHIFPYSRRKGTVADTLPDQIENSVKNARCSILSDEMKLLRQKFLISQIGKTEKVLVEKIKREGECEGYCMNYTPVKFSGDSSLCSKIVNVLITDVCDDYCIGKMII